MPCLSLCNDRCSWSLVMPRSSSTTRLVLLALTHLALCWLSCCVPLMVGRPKDFGCGGEYTGALLGQSYCVFYRFRIPDSAFCLDRPWTFHRCSFGSSCPLSADMVQTVTENRGVLHAVPDQVVGLPVVQRQWWVDVDFLVVAQRLSHGPDDH